MDLLEFPNTEAEFRRAGYRHPAPAPSPLRQLTGDPRHQARRLIDLQRLWQRLRARAGLKDARIHDLRHTFASAAVAAGQGLPMIGKLLGHTQAATTARYAHLAADPVKTPVEQVSSAASALG